MSTIEPETIMAVVVSLILITIGVFAVSTVVTVQQQTVTSTYSNSITVSNPSVAQTCSTGRTGMTDVVVTEFNGCNTTTVSSAYVTYSGSVITIAAGGMYST